jgi:hypothetical protein
LPASTKGPPLVSSGCTPSYAVSSVGWLHVRTPIACHMARMAGRTLAWCVRFRNPPAIVGNGDKQDVFIFNNSNAKGSIPTPAALAVRVTTRHHSPAFVCPTSTGRAARFDAGTQCYTTLTCVWPASLRICTSTPWRQILGTPHPPPFFLSLRCLLLSPMSSVLLDGTLRADAACRNPVAKLELVMSGVRWTDSRRGLPASKVRKASSFAVRSAVPSPSCRGGLPGPSATLVEGDSSSR